MVIEPGLSAISQNFSPKWAPTVILHDREYPPAESQQVVYGMGSVS